MKIATLIVKRAEALVLPMIQRLNGEYAWWSGLEWGEVPQDISEEAVESQRKQEVENVRRNLRPYMASWLACECNYKLWWEQNRDLCDEMHKQINRIARDVIPNRDDRAQLCSGKPLKKVGSKYRYDGKWEAADLFVTLITGPLFDKVCKCDRCERYFLNNANYWKKRFCSRFCSKDATARASTRKRREAEREEKLKRARLALQEYARLKRRAANWKVRVAKRASVTTRWLTRAINDGALKVPAVIVGNRPGSNQR